MDIQDLATRGFGLAWGHSRSYTNQLPGHFDFGNGYSWMVESWPYLVQEAPVTVVAVFQARRAYWFDGRADGFHARHGVSQALRHDAESSSLKLADPDGQVWEFYGFDRATEPQGMLKQVVSPGGQVTRLTYDGDRVSEVRRTGRAKEGATADESFLYGYVPSGENVMRLESVTVRRRTGAGPWREIARVRYSYYGSRDSYGSLGDLKTAVRQQQLDGGAWVDSETSYYRYYTAGEAHGFAHGLKYVLEPAAFANLAADPEVGDPFAAGDAKVAAYACNHFEYDGQRRVVKTALDGGDRQFSYAYTPGATGGGHNQWAMKTVETRPDGSQDTVYTNFLGNMLLTERQAGNDRWIEHYRYDNSGRQTFAADGAAVLDYAARIDAVGAAVLDVRLRADEGLINLTQYYPDTGDSGPDYGAPRHLRYEMIQRGSRGTPIVRSEYRYTQRTAGGVTIYLPAAKIRYADDNRPITTCYSYPQWYDETTQLLERVTTLPAISAEQNGPRTAASRVEQFDAFGNRAWLLDERGFISYDQYDLVTGARTRSIQDVDGAKLPLPAGWTMPAGGGLHLTTDYTVDDQGRTTQLLGAEHDVDSRAVRTAAWTVFLGLAHEVRRATGWLDVASGQKSLVSPVAISKQDAQGRELEAIQAVRGYTGGGLSAADVLPQTSYCRWTVNTYVNNHLNSTAVYHAIPEKGDGDEGIHYGRTDFDYDALGRKNRVRAPGGTITREVLDARGNVRQVFVGTDDTGATDADPTGGGVPGNNMLLVTEYAYDGIRCGCSGNQTRAIQHVDAETTRVTNYTYDWRNRRLTIDGEENFFQSLTYDNLDRVVRTERYDTTASGNLVARTETLYDDLGRVYRTIAYGVDPSGGSVTGRLAGNTWYDAAGNVIKQQRAGERTFTKTVYDGAGRRIATYAGYDLDEIPWADAASVADDTILEQTETQYDAAGKAILVTTRRRLPSADGTSGGLGNAATQPLARVSYQATWYDGLGRAVATADYGTNDGLAVTRPPQVPERSDTILVTTVDYNDRGEAFQMTDPAGKIAYRVFDDAGRQITQVQNYADGIVDENHPDEDVTVTITYTLDGQVATIAAVNPATGDQVTRYVYGTTLDTSGVARNNLRVAEIYPDSADPADRVAFTYNRQGQMLSKTDQNGTVHSYSYDQLGRQMADAVTTLSAGVDGTVRRIARSYAAGGTVERITSHDCTTGGGVVNEVAFVYNPFAQLRVEYQEHGGAVNTSNSPSVGYSYADGSQGHSRLTAIVYPNGRILDYSYDPGPDDAASRVSFLAEDSPPRLGDGQGEGQGHGEPIGKRIADYRYLGVGSIVQVGYPEPSLRCDYDAHQPGSLAGWDGFGRVTDLRWYNPATGGDVEHITHGYDRAGNRLWRQCSAAAAAGQNFDELYAYDGVNQLVSLRRGRVDKAQTALEAGTENLIQQWTLDATGNWVRFQEDAAGSGTRSLNHTRAHNPANEIAGISATAGGVWANPTYDRAGNTLRIPQPKDPKTPFVCVYDAWNRLVRVTDGKRVVATYQHDGRDFCTGKCTYTDGKPSEVRHFYYSGAWQVLEERVERPQSPGPQSAIPASQYVWGVRYIDELIIRDRDATGNGVLGERLYALQDLNWNVVALSDVAGTVVERYRYSAYGEPAFLTGAFASRDSSSYDVSTLYCGYRWDRVLESYLVRNRVLWPNVGRWDRRDPIGYRGGINLYGYVGNAPMDAVDPQGTASKAECEAQEAAATTNMAKYLDCMKSKKCAAPQLECRGNDDPTCKKGWRGFQPPSQPGVVVVCYQNIAASIILETFEHELMHVFDACCLGRAANVGPTGKVDCDQWACTEIRASTFNCYPGSPWWKAGGGTYKGCVMASATSSLATSSTCAASAAASVSKMYAQCAIPQGGALPGPVPWPLPLKGTPKALKGKTP